LHNLLEKQSLQIARSAREYPESTNQRQVHGLESGWTKLPINPPYSLNLPHVTG
jgi:hypothetical protein